MERRRQAAVIGLLIVFSGFVAPQYWGITDDIRKPVAQAVDDVGLMNTAWNESGRNPPDFKANCSIDEFAHRLAAEGFVRNPLAKLHLIDGKPTDGSWAYRRHPLATYQTHVTVVENGSTTNIHVHREWNYIRHPVKHLREPPGEVDADGDAHFRHLMQTDDSLFRLHPVREVIARDVDCRITAVD